MSALPLQNPSPVASELSLTDYLISQRQKVDSELKAFFKSQPEAKERVVESVAYSLFSASKRIRPAFCLEVARALSGDENLATPAAMALEMVHTYSLVHDDLPAMDDDDLRRGKPTNHKIYGEAYAILAGDALLTYAFEVLSNWGSNVKDSTRLQWVRELSESSGANGMVLGQAWDIDATLSLKKRSLNELESLHRKKTGALLAASVVMGGIAAEASPEILRQLRTFAEDMGLAFQIKDDVLDIIGGVEIGKPLKSDEKNEKSTYVSLLGLEKAKEEAEIWFKRALEQLEKIPFKYPHRLEELTRFVIDRKV